jgi:hypothetical protein
MAEHDLNPSAANQLSQEKTLLHTVRLYLDAITRVQIMIIMYQYTEHTTRLL